MDRTATSLGPFAKPIQRSNFKDRTPVLCSRTAQSAMEWAMPYRLKSFAISAAILATVSTAMAQQPSPSVPQPEIPAPTGHRQPTLRDLPPGLAHEEQTGDQSNSASGGPQQPSRTKSRSAHHSKASDQDSRASGQGVDRSEMEQLLGGNVQQLLNPKLPKGSAGGPLPDYFPNCEHPQVRRFCPP